MAINLICSKCYRTRKLKIKKCSCGSTVAKFKVRVKTSQGKWLTKQVPTLDLAKKVQLKFMSQAILSDTLGIHKSPILDHAWKKYLKYARLNKTSWKDDKGRYLTHLRPKLGTLKMDKINPGMIQGIIDGMNATHAPATRKQVLQLLNRVYNWCTKQGLYYGANPCKSITTPKVDNKITNPLTRDQYERLLNVLNTDENTRATLAIQYLLYSGRRKSDVLKLRWEDVDLKNGWVTYRDAKNTDHQSLALNNHCLAILKQAERIKISEWVFPCSTGKYFHSFSRTWYRIRKKAKITQRLHDLRHTFGAYTISSGKITLFELQHMLGHKEIKLTQRYSHMMPDALQDAVKRTDSVFG